MTGNTNPGLFAVAPSVSPTGTLTYTPAPNTSGTATITLVAQDDGGTANGGVDTSVPQTFVITVTAVNDPPSFTEGPDQTVLEDAGPRSVPNWATGVSAGPPDESGQTVSFVVTGNTNPGLFAVAPAISSSGTLTYTTAPNANGAATITVLARDNGGTSNGGVDSSPPQTFVITVTPVNDPPTFSKGPNLTVSQGVGLQTVPNWATAISAGPPDESSQAVTFSLINSNNALFSTQPSLTSNGTLTFTLAPNATGSATVTITARDNGGTANGGADTASPQTFTITVRPGVTVAVLSSHNPSAFGQTVTFTATLTPIDALGTPTGTVTFLDGTVVLGTGTLNGSGVATFTTSAFQLAGGSHAITASYGGDNTYSGSTGLLTQVVNPANTTTTLSAAPASGVALRAITFNVHVGSSAGIPTGHVVFSDQRTGAVLGTVAVDAAGNAVLVHHLGGPLGGHMVRADYQGDGDHAASSGTAAVTIVANGVRTSTVALKSSPNPSNVGTSVTFTATVRDTGAAPAVNPGGTVFFKDKTTGQILGYGKLALVSTGVMRATLTTDSLALGAHDIRARYSGNGLFAVSNSALVTEVVKVAPTRASSTSLAQSSGASAFGQTVSFTATVTDAGSGGTITPSGAVTFTDATTNTVLGTANLTALSSGTAKAILATNVLGVGSHDIVATYSGDTDFTAPNPVSNLPSNTVTHVVTQSSSTVTIA